MHKALLDLKHSSVSGLKTCQGIFFYPQQDRNIRFLKKCQEINISNKKLISTNRKAAFIWFQPIAIQISVRLNVNVTVNSSLIFAEWE